MTLRTIFATLALALLLVSCSADSGGEKETATPAGKGEVVTAGHPDSVRLMIPDWVRAARRWPDTSHWVFDSTFEITVDGLLTRIRPEVGLDASGISFPGQKPLIARMMVTMRPITVWEQARGFTLDSLVVKDPATGKSYPSLPLLSFERGYTENTVRTTFLPNMAVIREPDLADGQPINVTLYMTWDKRTIIGTFPTLATKYLRGRDDW